MGCLRTCYSYSRIAKEDPDEVLHWKARFLIYKVMEEADTRRRLSPSMRRVTKLKVKIGKRLKSLGSAICGARSYASKQVMKHLKHMKNVL